MVRKFAIHQLRPAKGVFNYSLARKYI
jgi:hypothetical protein